MNQNNKQIGISVIVPVYNSEKYLPTAIESIQKQTYKNFELILVNDGSTDNSESICRKYETSDSRIVLYNKENGGLCSARNLGISKAHGILLLFMDNDDEITNNALEIIWNSYLEYNADIIRFNRERIQIFENGHKKRDIFGTVGLCTGNECVKYSRSEFFEKYQNVRKSGCFSGIWNGAYKRELFENIRFDETITAGGEDWLVNIQLYSIFTTILFIPNILYRYYRRSSHSISTSFKDNRILAVIKTCNSERKLVAENNVPIESYIPSVVIYISQVIKIMMHKDSGICQKDKIHILESLMLEPGFNLSLKEVNIKNIRFLYWVYMLLFTTKKFKILLKASELILKIRHNN